MADQKPIINIETKVDQKGLDKSLSEVKKKVEHTSKEGSSVFKDMFAALSLEKVAEKGIEIVTDFFKDSVKSAKEAEVNTVQLKNSLQNLGRAADFESIIQSSEKLSEQFGINKEDVIKSTTALETYGKLTEDQIKKLQPIIIDFAAKSGMSMEDATSAIVGGLEGQGKSLKKYGVELKTGASAADNFTQIVGELGPAVAGAGEAAANTSAGKLKKFQNSMEELEVSVGEVIIPILSQLADQFQPILKEITPVVKVLVEALEPAFKAIAEIVGVLIKVILPPLELSFKLMAKQLNMAARVVHIIVVAVEKFAEKLESLIKGSKGASKAFEFFNKVIVAITDKFKAAYEWISKVIDKVEDFLGIKRENEPVKAIEAVLEAAERVDTKQEELDKKAAAREKKAADRAAKAKAKKEKESAKDNTKELAEQEKHLKELDDLKTKFVLTDRERLEKQNEDNIKAYQDTGIMDNTIYQGILDKNAAALKQFDQDAIKAQDDLEQAKFDIEFQKASDAQAKRQEIYDKDVAAHKAAEDAKFKATEDAVTSITALNDLVFSLKDANLKKGSAAEEAAAKKNFELNKKMQIASAIISGIQGVIRALTSETTIPDPFGEAFRVAAAVSVGASSLANIAKIRSTQFSGGSVAASLPSSSPSTTNTSLTPAQTIGLGNTTPQLQPQQGSQPLQVSVTETAITSTQNKINVINNRTTFG